MATRGAGFKRERPGRNTGVASAAGKGRKSEPSGITGRYLVARLRKGYPDASCTLDFKTDLELLVATILSAQCTDERVNKVTPALFARYPRARDYAEAKPTEIEALVRPTGFYRNKAKSLMGLGKALCERFGGKVPRQMEDLVTLPGVGRKTANVLLGSFHGLPAITVDTHVKRLSGRLGLSDETDPDRIERDLQKVVPKRHWTFLSHALILHGRRVCKARKPLCHDCSLAERCPSAEFL